MRNVEHEAGYAVVALRNSIWNVAIWQARGGMSCRPRIVPPCMVALVLRGTRSYTALGNVWPDIAGEIVAYNDEAIKTCLWSELQ